MSATVLQLWRGSGVPAYFLDDNNDGRYDPSVPFNRESWIVKQGNGSYIRYFLKGGQESYRSDGRLSEIRDVSDNAVTLTYDGSGKLITITSASGRAFTLGYAGDQPTTLSGPEGLIATYDYQSGRLSSVLYADDAHSGYTFTYDGTVGALDTVTDRSGRPLETHAYDPTTGRAYTSEIAYGQEKYTIDFQDNKSVVTDAIGNVTTYEYETVWGQRMVTRIIGPCSGCGGGGADTQEWTYDDKGRVTTHKDALGNVTSYEYDANGDLQAMTDPLGHVTRYTYDSQGRVLSVDFPDGGRTAYEQGPAGPTKITERVNATTSREMSIAYTSRGRPDIVTDRRGKQWAFGYLANGDLDWNADPFEQTDPSHHRTTYQYDLAGRLTGTTDPLNHPSPTRTYDVRGHQTHITNVDGTHMDFRYDGGGRLETVTDALGRVTTYTYGGVGRLRKVTDPAGGVTEYAYDPMSRLMWLIDAKGQQTTFWRDAFGRIIRTIYPDGQFEAFSYDGAGRLHTKVGRNNVTTTYSYDAEGRLLSKTYSDGTPATTYAYDATGMIHHLTSAANAADTLTWTYDLVGQVLAESTQANSSSVAYAYDGEGHSLSVSLVGTLYRVDNTYDDAGRLWKTDRGGGKLFTFGYDNASHRTSLSLPNGVTTTYAYDPQSRLTSLIATHGATAITSLGYGYNAVDDRTLRTTPGAPDTNYGYDALSRLTTVTQGATTTESYNYDAVGNRLASLTDPSWNYVPNNKLVSNSTATFVYDGNGNRKQKDEAGNTWLYDWNAENQLTRVRKNGAEINRFDYDPIGRRVHKYSSGNTRAYTYAREDIIRELVIPVDPNGTTIRRRYVHGPGIDEPLAIEDVLSGTYSYYHADALGSVVAMTDDAGSVSSSANYEAFGQGSVWGSYSFTGREWDATAELYYYRARYYDPKVGRFISEDPIRFGGGINFVAYVDNNPARNTDPSGLLRFPLPPIVPPPAVAGVTAAGAAAATVVAAVGVAVVALVYEHEQARALALINAETAAANANKCANKNEVECDGLLVDCVLRCEEYESGSLNREQCRQLCTIEHTLCLEFLK
jgi:RHS repeat-associated protein